MEVNIKSGYGGDCLDPKHDFDAAKAMKDWLDYLSRWNEDRDDDEDSGDEDNE